MTVYSVAFHPSKPNVLATGSSDWTRQNLEKKTGECTVTLEGHTGCVFSVAFHPTNPDIVATGSRT